jgi:hypothetical protein
MSTMRYRVRFGTIEKASSLDYFALVLKEQSDTISTKFETESQNSDPVALNTCVDGMSIPFNQHGAAPFSNPSPGQS